MVALIEEIIKKFGGRLAGSPEERGAQLFLKERLETFCREVFVQEFNAPLTSRFYSLKWFSFLYMVNLLLYWFWLPLALALSVFNVVFLLGHFVTYRGWLDPFFPKYPSLNVVGILDPMEEVRSTILVAGHMDCVREFKWWYKWKQTGALLTVLSGFLILLQMLVFAFVLGMSMYYNPEKSLLEWDLYRTPPMWANAIWGLLLLLSPMLVTYFNMHGKQVVDGAIDNLTGVALSVATGKYFADPYAKGMSNLKHTRLKIVSFGSEETGLNGSAAYAKEYLQELKAEDAILINIDTIRNAEHLTLLKGELMPMIKYPEMLVQKMGVAFENSKVPYTTTNLKMGATDGMSFALRGIPAVSIIGIDADNLDPTYHTRMDTLDNLDPEGLEELLKVVCHFIESWDEGVK